MSPLADHGLLFRFGNEIDATLSERIVALVDYLGRQSLPGVQDIIPSYTTLLLILDPSVADPEALISIVRRGWSGLTHDPGGSHQRSEIVIPVAYGGEGGPDLLDVARSTGLEPEEIITRHTGGSYQVGAIGFAPGFAFLIGLPPELATPRRSTPRTRVPAGSVGIGGAQTGIYSLPTPGGWSLIGQTTLKMFDPDREPPSLLRAGDRIRFEAVTSPPTTPMSRLAPARPALAFKGRSALEIVTSGLQDTVQDLGRVGYGQIGVNPSGAADRVALVTGNRLLGNPEGAAALEMTLVGPQVRFTLPGWIVLTGADFRATLNDLPLPVGAVRVVKPGDELRFPSTPPARGARAYLCLQGGIDVPLQLGSWSTDLTAGFGGLEGRPLRAGDRLAVGALRGDVRYEPGPLNSIRSTLRLMPGPQRDRFPAESWRQFLNTFYTVSPSSNRMGIRLDGPPLMPVGGADIISEGMVTGAIQVTGSGSTDRGAARSGNDWWIPEDRVVVAADLDALGQLKPGDQVTFAEG
jgi:KipI family sensor histidine kinase inhibitor